jgi:Long-chain acyl-CoA synthetases (AMP-forming)
LDQARILGCGSAPVAPALLEWYRKIGLNVTEAWGMTESYAYSTINYPFRADKIGTVGNAGPGVEIKIADDQEILVKSEGLFSGYYKNEEASAETLVDGWLHTGDLGELDSEGYLSISGRKKRQPLKLPKVNLSRPCRLKSVCSSSLMPRCSV